MRRLQTVLGKRDDFTLDDMQALQLDFRNSQAELLLPHMSGALSGFGSDSERAAAGILRDWSRAPVNARDSAGALIWEHWYPELARDVFGAELTDELLSRLLRRNYVLNHALDRLILQEPGSPWWRGQREALLRDSFARVVADLLEKAGPDPVQWRWDQVQSVHFKHELDGAAPLLGFWLSRGPLPWAGGHPVLGRARYGYDRPFVGRSGATVRVVVGWGRGEQGDPEVRAIIPGGQHGHPSSPHYDDQLESWLDGELDTLAAVPEDIAGSVTRLSPRR
jgi:penicillin amidase